jgi:hypothetical protein
MDESGGCQAPSAKRQAPSASKILRRPNYIINDIARPSYE